MKTNAGVLLSLLAALALGGCETRLSSTPPGPIEYRQGFAAGCDSGYVAAGHPYYGARKDALRYRYESLYQEGWDDGFATCKERYASVRLN